MKSLRAISLCLCGLLVPVSACEPGEIYDGVDLVTVSGFQVEPGNFLTALLDGGATVPAAIASSAVGVGVLTLSSDPEVRIPVDSDGRFSFQVPAHSEFEILSIGDDQNLYVPTRDDHVHKIGARNVTNVLVFSCERASRAMQHLAQATLGVDIEELLAQGYTMVWVSDAPHPEFVHIAGVRAKPVSDEWMIWAANINSLQVAEPEPAGEDGWARSNIGFFAVIKEGEPISGPTEIEVMFDGEPVGREFPVQTVRVVPHYSTFTRATVPMDPF